MAMTMFRFAAIGPRRRRRRMNWRRASARSKPPGIEREPELPKTMVRMPASRARRKAVSA